MEHRLQRAGTMGAFILEWVFLYFVWVLFTGKGGVAEFSVGALASFLATLTSIKVRKNPDNRFAFNFRWFAQAWRLPGYVFSGTWELLQALFKPESHLRAVTYDIGPENSQSRTRRSLAVTYTCSTPNFVVLGLDHKNKLMLFHQVKKGKVLKMTKILGAAP